MKALFWLTAIAAIFLAISMNVAFAQEEDSDLEDLCCIILEDGGTTFECRCITGWQCNKDNVEQGTCLQQKCFSNCKITSWALGVFIGAAAIIIILFIIIVVCCCRKKEDDYEVEL